MTQAEPPKLTPVRATDWWWLLLRGALAGVVLALLFRYGRHLADEIQRLDGWIEGLGWAAPAAFVAIVALGLPLFLPATALKITAGAVFPPAVGIAVYLAGQYGAALIIYVLGRRVLAERVRRRIEAEPRLAILRRAAEKGTAGRQFLVRMTPLSFALVSYALSSLGVALRPYLVGCLAAVPSTVVTVWFGTAVHDITALGEIASEAERHQVWRTVAIAAGALIVLLALLRWLRPHLRAVGQDPDRGGGPRRSG